MARTNSQIAALARKITKARKAEDNKAETEKATGLYWSDSLVRLVSIHK